MKWNARFSFNFFVSFAVFLSISLCFLFASSFLFFFQLPAMLCRSLSETQTSILCNFQRFLTLARWGNFMSNVDVVHLFTLRKILTRTRHKQKHTNAQYSAYISNDASWHDKCKLLTIQSRETTTASNNKIDLWRRIYFWTIWNQLTFALIAPSGFPSTVHVSSGVGSPTTLHSNLIGCPANATTFDSGNTNSGLRKRAMNGWKAKIFRYFIHSLLLRSIDNWANNFDRNNFIRNEIETTESGLIRRQISQIFTEKTYRQTAVEQLAVAARPQ